MSKNILLITSDQQHWQCLGVNDPNIKTPNLDKLAGMGTVFDRAYCPNPTCTPTRASIITGQYPSQHGAWTLGTKLPEESWTIGELLSKKGYKTALVGKAHFQPLRETEEFSSIESCPIMQDLDYWRNFSDTFYGFDHIELARNHADEGHVGQHYAIWLEEKVGDDWRKYFTKPGGTANAQEYRWNIPEELHYNTWIAERSNALMEECHKENQPFFLWASFFDPHPPYLAPEPWDTYYDPEEMDVPSVVDGEHTKNPPHFQMTQEEMPDFDSWRESGGACGIHGMHSHVYNMENERAKKNMAVYYGMVTLLDKYVGKILDQLETLGILEETLVVYSTDHGHFFGQHGLGAKGPFHYEDMVRIPFIASLPGTMPEGKRSNAMLSLVDLVPTFLDYLGLETPRAVTGISQWDVFKGDKAKARDHVIVENHHEPTTIHVKTYVDERYKITVYYNREYGEIFDLQEDPKELNNLWADDEAKELKSKLLLNLMHAEMGKEPIWMPRIWGA